MRKLLLRLPRMLQGAEQGSGDPGVPGLPHSPSPTDLKLAELRTASAALPFPHMPPRPPGSQPQAPPPQASMENLMSEFQLQ